MAFFYLTAPNLLYIFSEVEIIIGINTVLDLVSICPLIKVKIFLHIVSELPLYTFIYNEFCRTVGPKIHVGPWALSEKVQWFEDRPTIRRA